MSASVNVSNESDGPDRAESQWSGAITVNDSSSSTLDVTYRAVITAFNEQTVSHSSGSFDQQTITQNLSIISVEG